MRPEVLTPGGALLDDREVSWGDLAFDADLMECVLGHAHGAPALHSCDIQLRQGIGSPAAKESGPRC